MEQQKIQIDLSQTTAVKDSKGNLIWQEGLLLRKIPGMLIGSKEPQLYPIPIFYNTVTGELLKESIPRQLWVEMGLEEEKIKPNLSIVK